MATLSLQLHLSVSGSWVLPENIGPQTTEITVDPDITRRTVNLDTTNYTTLDPGEVSPQLWYFQNIGAYPCIVSFGAVDILTLQPGHFNLVSSTLTPVAKASGGNSKLLFAAYG